MQKRLEPILGEALVGTRLRKEYKRKLIYLLAITLALREQGLLPGWKVPLNVGWENPYKSQVETNYISPSHIFLLRCRLSYCYDRLCTRVLCLWISLHLLEQGTHYSLLFSPTLSSVSPNKTSFYFTICLPSNYFLRGKVMNQKTRQGLGWLYFSC